MSKIAIFITFLLFSSNLLANPNIKARTAILIDYHSDEILFELDPDAQIYPASMTKIMTSIIAFDLLKKSTFFRRSICCFRKCLAPFSSRIFFNVYNDK